MKYLMLVSALLFSISATAGSNEAVKVTPKEFDALKTLVGQWEGTTVMGGKETPINVSYELTSGGSAIVERLFSGTPHEMVSVYHARGNKIMMTHYCMLGNQPQMSLKKADDKTIAFETHGTAGISSMKEPHMRSLNINLIDPDNIREEWTFFDNGKKKDTTVITLTRKKEEAELLNPKSW